MRTSNVAWLRRMEKYGFVASSEGVGLAERLATARRRLWHAYPNPAASLDVRTAERTE